MNTREKNTKNTVNSDPVRLVREGIIREGRKNSLSLSALFLALLTAVSFFFIPLFVDLLLHIQPKPISLLFSAFWSVFITTALLLLPSTARRIAYCALYMLLLIYGFAQYVFFAFFGKPISFSSFGNAGEGTDYASSVFEKMGPAQLTVLFALMLFGVAVTVLIGRIPTVKRRFRIQTCALLLCIFLCIQFVLPFGVGMPLSGFTWTPENNARYVYDSYLDKKACLDMAGYYQYLSLDFYNCFLAPAFADATSQRQKVDDFFGEYGAKPAENQWTGLFEGRNVVLVMLESMDYLAIYNEENTPTIHKMMSEGINFTNYYAPLYGDGATFSNEFALNTGIITPTNGKAVYNYFDNDYKYSLPNLFKDGGYRVNSYHENHGSFYSREKLHNSLGYEKYYSFYDYGGSAYDVAFDTYLTRTPELLSDFLGEEKDAPFFNFFITYSAHLPYHYGDGLTKYAYRELVDKGELKDNSEDLNCLRAKARITDRALKELIEACPEDTVFVCATDHYCYGLSDETKSRELGDDENLRQRVPFFIYSKGGGYTPTTVDKYCANTDVLPTLVNLMGLEGPEYTLGNDILSPDYDGYVIFSDYSVLNADGYYKDGELLDSFVPEPDLARFKELSDYGYKRGEASNYILSSNYYKE